MSVIEDGIIKCKILMIIPHIVLIFPDLLFIAS